MKVKRLVSVLLATLLLVGMIPMNAMAALTWTEPSAKDIVEVQIKVSKNAPTAPTYESIEATATADVAGPVLTKNAAAANAAWDWANAEEEIEVNPEDTIYLGFKVKVVHPENYPTIASYLIGLQYTADILSPAYADGGEMEAADYTVDDFKAGFVLNGIAAGKAGDKWRVNATALKDEAKGPLIRQYIASMLVDTATGARISSGEYNGQMPLSMNTSNNKNYACTVDAATWDFVFPMYVKADAKGTATVEMVSPLGSTSSEVVVSGVTIDGTAALSAKQTAYNGANVTKIQSNDVKIKVASNDPDLEVADADKTVAVSGNSATLVVSNNGKGAGTFATAASASTNWTVEQTGKTLSVSNNVSLSADKKKATLTVTGVDAGEITVKGDASVLTGGTGTLSAVKFTAVAAPAAPSITASDTDTDTAVTVPAGTYYKLGSDAWTEAPTGGKTLTVAELTAAMTGTPTTADGVSTYKGVFQLAADAEGKIKTDVPLKKFAPVVAAGTALGTNDATVDFVAEKLFLNTSANVSATVDGTAATDSGSGATITPKAATQSLVVTKGASSDTFGGSTTVTLPKQLTHGDLTATAADSDTAKAGKTKVTGLTAGDKYIDNSAKDGTTTGTPALSELTKTVAAGTTEIESADAVVGTYFWAATPGKNATGNDATDMTKSSFATAPVKVANTGWNYSQVALKTGWAATESGTTIELTKTGPIDWASSVDETSTYFTLAEDEGGTAPTISAFNKSTGVLTISAALTKGKNYTLVVKKTAITGNALNSASGTDTTLKFAGPTDNAVSISAEGFTLSPTTVSAGTTDATITVSAGVAAGKEITKVESGDKSKLTITENSINGNTFKVSVPNTVTGKPAENPVALTITTSPIAMQYAKTAEGVELADATAKTIALSNAAKLTGVTITVTPVGSAPAAGLELDADGTTLKTAGNKFSAKGDYKYKVSASNGAADVEITISVTGIAATPDYADATNPVTHKWDSKPTITETEIANLKWKDKNGNDLTVDTGSLNAALAKAIVTLGGSDVGTQTVTIPKTENALTVSGVAYDVAAGTFNVTVTAADVASVAVGTAKAKPDTIANVAKAIGATEVTATTDTGATVKAKLSDVISEPDIQAIITDKLTTAALPDAIEKAKKDWIADYKDQNPGASDDDANTAAAAAQNTIEATAKAAVAAELADAGYKVKSGTDVSFDLPYIKADGTQVKASASAKLSDNVNAKDLSGETIAVTAKVQSPPVGGGTYQPSVELDTENFGTPDGPVELDENNKIVKLPGVTGTKLGVVFKGWATQEGNPNTIVKEGREITADTTLHGIFEGYMSGDNNDDGQRVARPNDSVSRAELVTMLVRAAGLYDASMDYTTSFGDAQGAWYTTYIGCAQTAGILEGDAEGTARPRDEITREEAAILIAKTFKVDVAIGGTTEYVTDFNNTHNWAKDWVAALVNNGTIVGYPVGDSYEFRAGNDITRAEVAAMINKYLGLAEAQKKALAADSSVKSPFADVQNRESWYYTDMAFATLNVPANNYGTEVTYPTR